MAESVRQQGILQPLIVAQSGRGEDAQQYILIAGERRLRAARRIGLETVPCVVRQASRQQMLEWALVENIQRADLNPIERAEAFRQYMDRFSLRQQDVAAKLGLPRATVANCLRMLDLCETIQGMIRQKMLSSGHAKVLAGLMGDQPRQLALAPKVVAEGLSVRQLEQLISPPAKSPQKAPQADGQGARRKPPYLLDLEEQLAEAVGTRVKIMPGRAKHAGRIVVDFYSLDDFDRITAKLGLQVQS